MAQKRTIINDQEQREKILSETSDPTKGWVTQQLTWDTKTADIKAQLDNPVRLHVSLAHNPKDEKAKVYLLIDFQINKTKTGGLREYEPSEMPSAQDAFNRLSDSLRTIGNTANEVMEEVETVSATEARSLQADMLANGEATNPPQETPVFVPEPNGTPQATTQAEAIAIAAQVPERTIPLATVEEINSPDTPAPIVPQAPAVPVVPTPVPETTPGTPAPTTTGPQAPAKIEAPAKPDTGAKATPQHNKQK